jgi:CRISPR/Cas system-associated endoribonuclease Cas2
VEVSEARTWLLLSYKVPREPTANRVYAWRKLKKLGAVSLQDSVWVLPATPHTREQFRWLASEIDELGGESTLWESRLIGGQERRLIAEFEAPVEAGYREILAGLKKRRPDLAALSRRYQQVMAQDYFRCELGHRVRDSLLAAKGDGE